MMTTRTTQFLVSLLYGRITLLLLWFTVCSAESLAQTHGPLRVHAENPRYFADASGQAILLTGSHTWNNLVDIGPDDPPQPIDFDTFLRWLQAHGQNFTRGWTWEPTRWNTSAMKSVDPAARVVPCVRLNHHRGRQATRHTISTLERCNQKTTPVRH
jgi:hypothetical protein